MVSADRLVEERTGAPCFRRDGSQRRKLLPGMTSEVMIRTGNRTMLAYPAEPLRQNFNRAMREK